MLAHTETVPQRVQKDTCEQWALQYEQVLA